LRQLERHFQECSEKDSGLVVSSSHRINPGRREP
jgi:hypothetical protein